MRFSEDMFARHMAPISGSAIRDIFKLLGKPGMISFAGGNPSNAALEPEIVAPIASAVIEKYGASLLQYGATEGFLPFKESAAAFLAEDGVNASPAEVLPTQGSTQGMDLLLKALVNPGDTVLVENPTFLGALQAIRTYHANIVPVESDENGVIPEALEQAVRAYHPKLAYIIPNFQNPTGITLALNRRKAVARIASQYGVVVAEDDPYRDLRYAGEALPTIYSFDEEGWVVYLASFSKLISPGMRVGALVCRIPALMRKCVIGKQSSDLHTPLITQAIVDEYLRRGLLRPHIARILGGYRDQLNAMLKGFDGFPKGSTHTVPEGGLFVWATLPEGTDAKALLSRAIERNVAFVPGEHFYPEGGHTNTLRLNFSNSPADGIRTGMRALSEVIHESTTENGGK